MKANCVELQRYNGTGWDLIGQKTNITKGSRDKESIESEDVLDCIDGTVRPKQYEPGQKTLGEWSVSVVLNHDVDDTNPEFHHLLIDDYESDTATFYKIKHADGSGYITHAWVKTEGDESYDANENLIVEFTLQPTGAIKGGHIRSNDVDTETLPVGITAPQANYTH